MAQLYNNELTLKHYINNEKNKLFAEGGDYDDPSIIMFNICRNSQNGKIFTDFFSNLNYNFDKKFDFFKPNSQLNNDNLLIINGNGTRNAFNFSFVIDNFRLYLFKPGPEFRNNSDVNDVNYINNSFLDTLYYKIFVFIKFFTDDIIRIYQYQIKNISFENNIDFIKQKYFTFDKSIFGNKSYTYNFYVNKYLLLAKIIILNFKQDSNFLSITEYKIRGGGPQTNMNDNLIYKEQIQKIYEKLQKMEKIIDDLMIEYNKYIENNFKIGGIKMHQKMHQKMRKTKKSYKKKPYNKMRKTKKSIKHTL